MNEPDLFNVDFYFSAESSAVFGVVTIDVRKIKKIAAGSCVNFACRFYSPGRRFAGPPSLPRAVKREEKI